MRDAAISVLRIAEMSDEASFNADDMLDWPGSQKDVLLNSGLLKEIDRAHAVPCNGCEKRCVEEVHIKTRSDNSAVAFISCGEREDTGRVNVALDRLRRWSVDWERLASFLVESLDTTGCIENIVPRRLWHLSMKNVDGVKSKLFLAVGLERAGGNDLLEDIRRCASLPAPVVIVPLKLPPPQFHDFRFVCLDSVLEITPDDVRISSGDFEAVLTGKQKSKSAQSIAKTFPLPAGKDFTSVGMTLLDGQKMEVRISGVDTKVFTFQDMGFAHSNSKYKKPIDLWGVLCAFANRDGQITWTDDYGSQEERTQLKTQVYRIKGILLSFFQTKDTPFRPYSKKSGYRTRFIITDGRTVR